LDLNRFKGTIPDEAHDKINSLEKLHQTQIKDFKIMAPSKLFKLDSTDDPLLFAPLGNNYYYLLHKWGNDMSPMRRTIVWPFKNIVNMCVSLILISLVLTWLMPLNLFNPNPTMSDFLLVFLFVFKSIAAVAIFYGFALGKNFNRAIWDSRYYNS
jgi:ABC-type multidrug transport system fused ATPase/permease subunit